MEKFLEIITNPYLYIFLTAFIIMGLTQLIKFIPCFKDNNWNISFPVLFGYVAAFGWAILTKYDIQANLQILLAFGAGIGALSSTLYNIIKKLFDKNYKAEKELENNELYKLFNSLISNDVKDFNNKTIIEKFNFIQDIVKDIKRIVDNGTAQSKEDFKIQIDSMLGKFLTTDTLSQSINNIMNLIEKKYHLPVKQEEKKEENIEEVNKGE